MSFDVFAQSFREGVARTGNASSANAVLSKVSYQHEPEFDSYCMTFPDGSHLQMYGGGLDNEKSFDGVMFALRGMSEEIGRFIFEFTQAAGFVLMPAMEPACVLLTDESQRPDLPADLEADFQIIPISSGPELLAALDGGFDTWRAYRDQVVRDEMTDGA